MTPFPQQDLDYSYMTLINRHVQCRLLLPVPGIEVHRVVSQDGDHFRLISHSGMVDGTIPILVLQGAKQSEQQRVWGGVWDGVWWGK